MCHQHNAALPSPFSLPSAPWNFQWNMAHWQAQHRSGTVSSAALNHVGAAVGEVHDMLIMYSGSGGLIPSLCPGKVVCFPLSYLLIATEGVPIWEAEWVVITGWGPHKRKNIAFDNTSQPLLPKPYAEAQWLIYGLYFFTNDKTKTDSMLRRYSY